MPEESIFVDDKKENVKGALAAGFGDAFQLTTEEKIIDTVSQLLETKEKIAAMEKATRESAIIDANERIYDVLMELYTN